MASSGVGGTTPTGNVKEPQDGQGGLSTHLKNVPEMNLSQKTQ